MRVRPSTTRYGTLLLVTLLELSCNSDERIADDGRRLNPDYPDDAQLCEQRREDYEAFLGKHSACERDDDCAVVGNCGPNADFDAVRAEVQEEAMERKVMLCERTHDGPVFEPVCRAKTCELKMRTDTCCGCPPDAGDSL